MSDESLIEYHPLQPFVPDNTRILLLGSFPPPRSRWSMDFFYPNYINDMWRVFGLLFHQDAQAFVDVDSHCFRLDKIQHLLHEKGIALYDAARAVRRLQGNASDKFLEIVEPTDILSLTARMPFLKAIAATGSKSCEILSGTFGTRPPKVGHFVEVESDQRLLHFYRMPSTSRAYPLALSKKAETYGKMFTEIGLL